MGSCSPRGSGPTRFELCGSSAFSQRSEQLISACEVLAAETVVNGLTHRREQVDGALDIATLSQQSRKADDGSQLEGSRALPARGLQCLTKASLGDHAPICGVPRSLREYALEA